MPNPALVRDTSPRIRATLRKYGRPSGQHPGGWWTGKAAWDKASFSAFGPMLWRPCLISMQRSAGKLRAGPYDASVKYLCLSSDTSTRQDVRLERGQEQYQPPEAEP
jgi:hypothetical protein